MCASCFTQLDAWAVQAGGAAAAATTGWRALRAGSPFSAASRARRRDQRWEQSARLLRHMGHDPVAVIGPRPE